MAIEQGFPKPVPANGENVERSGIGFGDTALPRSRRLPGLHNRCQTFVQPPELSLVTSTPEAQEPVKSSPHLIIDRRSGDVSIRNGTYKGETTIHSLVARELLLHLVSKPGERFTYDGLSAVKDAAVKMYDIPSTATRNLGGYMSYMRNQLQGEAASPVIKHIWRGDNRFDYQFDGTAQFEELHPYLTFSTADGREIVPGRPMLQVLRRKDPESGDNYALILHSDGHSTKRVTVRGDFNLTTFDYMADYQNRDLNSRNIYEYVLPQSESKTTFKFVDNLSARISNGLSLPDLFQTDLARQHSTRTLAANISYVNPVDIATGEYPYEALNDPQDQTSLVWIRGTDNILQLPQYATKLLNLVPVGKENAQTSQELGMSFWPEKSSSEINTDSLGANLRNIRKILGKKGPQIQRTVVDGQQKIYIDAEEVEAFRQVHLFKKSGQAA